MKKKHDYGLELYCGYMDIKKAESEAFHFPLSVFHFFHLKTARPESFTL